MIGSNSAVVALEGAVIDSFLVFYLLHIYLYAKCGSLLTWAKCGHVVGKNGAFVIRVLVCSFTAGRDKVEGSGSFAAGTTAEHAEGTHSGERRAVGRS
jgi:hypothetical protein